MGYGLQGSLLYSTCPSSPKWEWAVPGRLAPEACFPHAFIYACAGDGDAPLPLPIVVVVVIIVATTAPPFTLDTLVCHCTPCLLQVGPPLPSHPPTTTIVIHVVVPGPLPCG